MRFLNAFEYTQEALDVLHAGERVQVPKDVLEDVGLYLVGIMEYMKGNANSVMLKTSATNLVKVITEVEKDDVSFLADSTKDIIVTVIKRVQLVIVDEIYQYYTDNDIEEDNNVLDILADVIRIKRGEEL